MLATLKAHGSKLLEESSGQNLLEYALVASLIGLAAVVSLRGVGSSLTNLMYTLMSKAAVAWPG